MYNDFVFSDQRTLKIKRRNSAFNRTEKYSYE